MFEPSSAGLAGLLTALQPRADAPAPPPPDLDGIRQEGWQAGFVAGEAAGTATADAALAPLRVQLAAAAAALEAACVIDADRLRPVFAALVERVAEAVLMTELRSGAAVLGPLVAAALAQVRVGEAPVLRAHPETLAGLGALCVTVEGDAALARDEFLVSAPDFVIDAGLSARLADVVAGLA